MHLEGPAVDSCPPAPSGAGRDELRRGDGVRQHGFATLLALVGMAVVLLVVLTGLAVIQTTSKQIVGQLKYQGHALNTSMAGATEALAWFQKQPSQPVTSFAPQRNLTASPPINETEDPALGIVRTFEISSLGAVWGRYEVRKHAVIDVTAQRGKTGSGTVWQLESTGLIFSDRNRNSQLDFTDSNGNGVFDWGEPGEVVAQRIVRAEVQRLSVVLPAGDAAIQGANCAGVDLTSGASANRVLGSSSGVGVSCKAGSGYPNTTGAMVTGNPPIQSSVNPYNDSIPAVFGVTQDELVAMASVKASSAAGLPHPLPAMALVVVSGDAAFTSSQPLIGAGILVVFGNATIPAGSNFNGVVYVTGEYRQSAPSMIRGAVVGRGAVIMQGGGDIAEIDWDSVIVQQVRSMLGGYRFTRTAYITR